MITHNLSPVLLDLPGPLEIRWYGIMYILAFFITYYYCRSEIRQGHLKITEKQLDNYLGLSVISMILGARLFYALFYNPSYFLAQPWKIIAVWEGGLSFHGGVAGIVLATLYFVRKHHIRFLHFADILVIPLALGNALGRMGNFINAEIYGRVTTLPWGVLFPGVEGMRHPTQLYAVLYNVIIFGILFAYRRKLKTGQTFGLFLILYSVFRFVNEIFKDMIFHGPLTMGQWLTIPLLFVGLWLFFSTSKRT